MQAIELKQLPDGKWAARALGAPWWSIASNPIEAADAARSEGVR